MRPAEFSTAAIIKAGKRLQAREPDRRITPSAIRTELGGGGLERIKTVWADHLAQPYESLIGVSLTAEDIAILQRLREDSADLSRDELVAEVFMRARRAIKDQHTTATVRQVRHDLQRQLDAAMETIAQLESDLHVLQQLTTAPAPSAQSTAQPAN